MKTRDKIKATGMVLGIALSIFAVCFVVLAWTGPGLEPPGGNVPSALHTGTTGQVKDGPLGIEGVLHAYTNLIVDGDVGIGTTPGTKLDVAGTARMTGFQLGTSATAGRVLTTDASGVGTWQAAPSAPVTSVFGRTGAVTAAVGDYSSFYPTLTGGGASGTWSIGITGNANTVGGLSVHTGRNNEANKIVRTQSSGYLDVGWINTTSGDRGTTAPTRIYASNDAYLRYYTPANFASVMNSWLVRTSGDQSISGFKTFTGHQRINGNLGVGTHSTSYGLYVYDSSHAGYIRTTSSSSSVYGLRVRTGSDSIALTVMGNGRVGVGTNAPAEKLHVAGRIRLGTAPSNNMDAATKLYVDNAVGAAGAVPGFPCPSQLESSDRSAATFANAVTTCRNLGNDWRLPTAEELSCFVGAAGVSSSYLWTRSPHYGSNNYWVIVRLTDGAWSDLHYTTSAAFRCVR